MKTEEMKKTIQQEIEDINDKLIELDNEKEKLIQLQTQLEMEKRNDESKATAERIARARKSSHRKILGRKNAKLGLLNSIKEQRRVRREKLDG